MSKQSGHWYTMSKQSGHWYTMSKQSGHWYTMSKQSGHWYTMSKTVRTLVHYEQTVWMAQAPAAQRIGRHQLQHLAAAPRVDLESNSWKAVHHICSMVSSAVKPWAHSSFNTGFYAVKLHCSYLGGRRLRLVEGNGGDGGHDARGGQLELGERQRRPLGLAMAGARS